MTLFFLSQNPSIAALLRDLFKPLLSFQVSITHMPIVDLFSSFLHSFSKFIQCIRTFWYFWIVEFGSSIPQRLYRVKKISLLRGQSRLWVYIYFAWFSCQQHSWYFRAQTQDWASQLHEKHDLSKHKSKSKIPSPSQEFWQELEKNSTNLFIIVDGWL